MVRVRRRVLIAAGGSGRRQILELFGDAALEGWEALVATSFEEARFVLQHDACDVLLVDESLSGHDDWKDLSWLTNQRTVPVVLLAEPAPDRVIDALERGIHQWLPRELALRHADLLAAALHQGAMAADSHRQARLVDLGLQESRRQVSRLVNLLWETTPNDARTHWCSQRHMMERLQEEVTRSKRYGTPMSVALGEIQPASTELASSSEAVEAWAAERVLRAKRRSDVAGRYGPHMFILLLAHTSEAGAAVCCRRLREVLEQPGEPSPLPPGGLRTHFGLATYSAATPTLQRLLSSAEQRLEEAKKAAPGNGVIANGAHTGYPAAGARHVSFPAPAAPQPAVEC